ncbi:hypothetical protein P3X46_016855 [Hevea brasiliensis]|uniref:Uncharacterized protein n=1 Tax=Hevea brasiliensis TaxID=3981 RepID=A0ABQ9M1L4_HEVBR|nr:hypothetical protein P3X46_016855 [Hevea brasiliensis]
MENRTSSSSVSGPQDQASNQDELFMQQSLLFSDTIKDLKNLRQQLYSAAYIMIKDFFFSPNVRVVEILKDYAIKALINSIDHLGSVAYTVNSFSNEKISQVSTLELRFSCLEQRLQIWQEYINHGGLSQQFLMLETPKYRNRYIFHFPFFLYIIFETSLPQTVDTKLKFHMRNFSADDNSHKFKTDVRATIKGTSPFISREGHSRLQSPQFSSRQETFTFSSTWINERSDKRAGSPLRFPLTCSGSLLPKRAISLNNTNANRRYLSEPRRSIPFSTYLERDGANEVEQYSNKSKRLLKALLSMRKSRKDHRLYKYLDETLNKLEAWQQPERPLQLHISPS